MILQHREWRRSRIAVDSPQRRGLHQRGLLYISHSEDRVARSGPHPRLLAASRLGCVGDGVRSGHHPDLPRLIDREAERLGYAVRVCFAIVTMQVYRDVADLLAWLLISAPQDGVATELALL